MFTRKTVCQRALMSSLVTETIDLDVVHRHLPRQRSFAAVGPLTHAG